MRRTAVVAAALTAAALAACGGYKEFRVSQAPTEPLRNFGSFEVVPFTVDGLEQLESRKQANARETAAFITGELVERLKDEEFFVKGGKKIKIEGRLVGFNPGSQALRYFVGAGAGEGEIAVEVTFMNDSGGAVAKGFAIGTVHGGMYGGTTRSASKRLIKAIVNFIDDNYDEVTSVATTP